MSVLDMKFFVVVVYKDGSKPELCNDADILRKTKTWVDALSVERQAQEINALTVRNHMETELISDERKAEARRRRDRGGVKDLVSPAVFDEIHNLIDKAGGNPENIDAVIQAFGITKDSPIGGEVDFADLLSKRNGARSAAEESRLDNTMTVASGFDFSC